MKIYIIKYERNKKTAVPEILCAEKDTNVIEYAIKRSYTNNVNWEDVTIAELGHKRRIK